MGGRSVGAQVLSAMRRADRLLEDEVESDRPGTMRCGTSRTRRGMKGILIRRADPADLSEFHGHGDDSGRLDPFERELVDGVRLHLGAI